MQLAPGFTVKGKHRTPAEALALATDIEAAVGAVLTGNAKPEELDVGLLTGAVQALRDHVKPEPQGSHAELLRQIVRQFKAMPPEQQERELKAAGESELGRVLEPLFASREVADPIAALVAQHARLIDEGNNYAYFELAYTRATGWMAWITDKPLAFVVESPDRKVLFKGQGDSPEEACRDALKDTAAGA